MRLTGHTLLEKNISYLLVVLCNAIYEYYSMYTKSVCKTHQEHPDRTHTETPINTQHNRNLTHPCCANSVLQTYIDVQNSDITSGYNRNCRNCPFLSENSKPMQGTTFGMECPPKQILNEPLTPCSEQF